MAVEKGEVVSRAHNVSAHFGREPFDSWHKEGFDRHIVQTGRNVIQIYPIRPPSMSSWISTKLQS